MNPTLSSPYTCHFPPHTSHLTLDTSHLTWVKRSCLYCPTPTRRLVNCSHCKADSEDVFNVRQVYYSSSTHALLELPATTMYCVLFSLIELPERLAAWRTTSYRCVVERQDPELYRCIPDCSNHISLGVEILIISS